MKHEQSQKNALKLLKECGNLRPKESVLIITDAKQDPKLYGFLFEAANRLGANPVVCLMNQVPPGGNLPPAIDAAAKTANVIIAPTSTSIFHSEGIRVACLPPYNARLLALSEWQLDTLESGGIEADFGNLAPKVLQVRQEISRGRRLHLTTPGGTCIEADIDGRDAWANTGISDKPGIKMGLPTIEVFIAPREESVNGSICVDVSCSGGIGLIQEPIRVEVKNGLAVSVTGGKEAEKLRQLLRDSGTGNAYQVAEIAVGLNPHCRVTGNINEDEGKYGTCHLALGNNTGFGGVNFAPLHIDMVQWKPTLVVDGKTIFEAGECVI